MATRDIAFDLQIKLLMIGDSGRCESDSIWPVLRGGSKGRLLGVFLRTLAGGDGNFITVKFKGHDSPPQSVVSEVI